MATVNLDQAIPVKEAARRLGISKDTLRRNVPSAELPFFRSPGGHRRYLPSDVEAYRARRQES